MLLTLQWMTSVTCCTWLSTNFDRFLKPSLIWLFNLSVKGLEDNGVALVLLVLFYGLPWTLQERPWFCGLNALSLQFYIFFWNRPISQIICQPRKLGKIRNSMRFWQKINRRLSRMIHYQRYLILIFVQDITPMAITKMIVTSSCFRSYSHQE